MLTDPSAEGAPESTPLEHLKERATNPHHFIAGFGALPQNSQGRPWNGDYVHATGNLIQDLTFNYLLESGARREKLRCYEACDHPAARALFGYLLVRGGVHQVAYARAIENLTGADMSKLFPSPRIDTERIPECRPHIEAGTHRKLYRFSPSDYLELAAVFNGPRPETGEELFVEDGIPDGVPWTDLPAAPTPFVPEYDPAEIAEVARSEEHTSELQSRQYLVCRLLLA